MEKSSNWSLRVSDSDLSNKSECSEIDVVGIDEKIPEQVEARDQASPVIENQLAPKKSRKRLADVIYHFLKDQLEGINFRNCPNMTLSNHPLWWPTPS